MEYRYVREDELYHYGVPGMKWGVRKQQMYEKRSAKYASKVGRSKTRLGKQFNLTQQYNNKIKADRQARINNSSGIVNKYKSTFGLNALSKDEKTRSEFFKNKAQYGITKRGRQDSLVESFNRNSRSNYLKKIANSKGFINKAEMYCRGYVDMPIKRLSGRTTTLGKDAVSTMLTFGILPAVQDYKYKKAHKGEYGRV